MSTVNPAGPPLAGPPLANSPLEILIAEDSATQAQRLQHILEQRGYRVTVTVNGRLALEAARRRKPTLIISDVVMPEMDGYELCREIKADASLSEVPVILVTTLADPQDVIRGLACRADNFILKPYNEDYLLNRIQFVLVNREMRQTEQPGMGLEIFFNGQKHFITADRLQILNLLLSTYEAAMQRNQELSTTQHTLRQTNSELQRLTHDLEDRVLERTHELERTNEALRASDARTRLIIETALDAVVTIDSGGIVTDWNTQAETTFGWTRQEMLGRLLAETIIPQRYREAHRRGMERLLTTGEAVVLNQRIELSALRRDAQEFPIELAITPIRSGNAMGFSAFVRDITDRKRAEVELRESQQRFQTLAESLPQLVWTCAPDGQCDYLSRQWVEYTGRPAEEQLGYGWAEQLHPEDRERVQTEWTKATEHGNLFDIEFRIRGGNGAYRWFKTRAVPLRDAAGNIVKWFGSNTDFEDHKRAQRKLQTQLGRLDLLRQITQAIGERQDLKSIFKVVIDRLETDLPIDFGCICLYDPAAQTLTVSSIGKRSASLARELPGDWSSAGPVRISSDANGLARCLKGTLIYEPDIAATRFPFLQQLSHLGLRSLVLAPLTAESGVFGVLIAARRRAFSSNACEFLSQLSEHVALAAHQTQLYEALRQAYDDLRQTQQAVMQQERLRALGQMASGIAHDINNAISPVALYTESLLEREPNLSERARDYLVTIQRAIDDVAQTVARMREFYRPRELELQLADVELNRLIRQVLDLTQARWSDQPQQRGVMIELRPELAADLPDIRGAESEIRDALTNLIFNAVDAMPEGGVLGVRTQEIAEPGADGEPARYVRLEVNDSGIGMDEDTRRRCLEPFFTTKGERGTGLGLPMVYGMAQRHGAELTIDSKPGTGTTMRLLFPIRAPAFSSTVRLSAAQAPARSLRILVVDDDPVLIESLSNILKGDGHEVIAANGGQAGIDTFLTAQQSDVPFEVVITDLGMPYVDGRKVADSVRAAAPHTPIILLTGWGQRLQADNDKPAQVDRLLSKPPRLHELREALAQLCEVRHE